MHETVFYVAPEILKWALEANFGSHTQRFSTKKKKIKTIKKHEML